MKPECFFRTCLFFKRDNFPDNCVNWTNESVSSGAQNYECLSSNVARFVHVESRFDKIRNIFQGFGSLVSLRLQKGGGAKSKKIGRKYPTGTQGAQALIVRS